MTSTQAWLWGKDALVCVECGTRFKALDDDCGDCENCERCYLCATGREPSKACASLAEAWFNQ